jgi:hypothetical protein
MKDTRQSDSGTWACEESLDGGSAGRYQANLSLCYNILTNTENPKLPRISSLFFPRSSSQCKIESNQAARWQRYIVRTPSMLFFCPFPDQNYKYKTFPTVYFSSPSEPRGLNSTHFSSFSNPSNPVLLFQSPESTEAAASRAALMQSLTPTPV